MATTKRTRIATVLLLLVLIGAVAFVVFGLRGDKNEQPGKTTDSALSEPGAGTSDAGSTDSTASAESGQKTPTTSTAKKRALAVKDKPVPPPVPAQPTQPTPPDPWLEYLQATKQVVTGNSASLSDMAAQIAQALAAHDGAKLGSLVAPDEGSQTAYVASLADRYPTITATVPSPTVNIYTVNGATIYITYVIVTWQDAGIISQHTIPVALRFVNGAWYLTTLDDSTDGLHFVQTVQL